MTSTPATGRMIDLRDNTNLWGPPPAAVEALRGLDPRRLAAYPGADGGVLLPALAEFLGVSEAELALGCGSDDLIDAAFRLAEPGSALAYPEPTFSMVPVFGRANRLRLSPTPFEADGSLDAGALPAGASDASGIIYLCSPNNPTGTSLPEATLRTVVEHAPGLVVLDAAYAEFTGEPEWAGWAGRHDRLLVLRTFSKAWGLAGLRIGYAIGAPPLITRLRALRGPYGVNAVAEAAAAAALAHDGDWMRARSREAAANRDRLLGALRARGLAPLPSAANFVLLPVGDARGLASRMLARGVAVRAFPALPGIGDAVRISVGPWPLLEEALAALEEALACG